MGLGFTTVMRNIDVVWQESYALVSFIKFHALALFKPPADVTCESGRVHLVGGDAVSRGRVEYCYDGSWYSVCASDLDEEGARVICNTLGTDDGKHDLST